MEQKNKTIVVAEDHEDLRDALSDILHEHGYIVHATKDGEEALEVAFKEKPDLMLLDMMMPKVDGIGVITKVRADEGWGKYVKIIVLTASTDNENLSEAIEIGGMGFEYLTKTDWSLQAVANRIDEILA